MELKCTECDGGFYEVNDCAGGCMCGGCTTSKECEDCSGNGVINYSEEEIFDIILELLDNPSDDYLKEMRYKFNI
jgi:hypothetical protein